MVVYSHDLRNSSNLCHQLLVLDKTVKHVEGQPEVHAAFPVVERVVFHEVALDQFLRRQLEVKHRVRLDRDAVEALHPVLVEPAHHVPRHERVNVPVCQHDEPGTQRRDDDVFQLIRKVGRVKQTQRSPVENVPVLRPLEFLAGKVRALESDLRCGMAAGLKPFAQTPALRRTPRTVGSLDNDQPTRQLAGLDPGQRVPNEAFGQWLRRFHSRGGFSIAGGFALGRHDNLSSSYWPRSIDAANRWRTCSCCFSIG